jgi:hypothetical protein
MWLLQSELVYHFKGVRIGTKIKNLIFVRHMWLRIKHPKKKLYLE